MRSTWRHHRRGPGSPAIVGIDAARRPRPAGRTWPPWPPSASDFSGRAATGRRGAVARACSSGVSDGSTRKPVASTAPSARSPQVARPGGRRRRSGGAAASGGRAPGRRAGAPSDAASDDEPTTPHGVPALGDRRAPIGGARRRRRAADPGSSIGGGVDGRRRPSPAAALALVAVRRVRRGAVSSWAGRRRRCSPRRRARRGPGVGSNGTQPSPSNQTSGQAWAFLPSTERVPSALGEPGREADGDAGRDAERRAIAANVPANCSQ